LEPRGDVDLRDAGVDEGGEVCPAQTRPAVQHDRPVGERGELAHPFGEQHRRRAAEPVRRPELGGEQVGPGPGGDLDERLHAVAGASVCTLYRWTASSERLSSSTPARFSTSGSSSPPAACAAATTSAVSFSAWARARSEASNRTEAPPAATQAEITARSGQWS